ncbi:iron permease FTR1/Fip1/EfeU [Chaetomium strumarium]|uniref:Iron permease FTR1/Fip1/EfeU n=1 Tax=Chaetomium strumarium TaxID=1170767 RepID=A0AAJ0M027_9PEZI|nr:iron permease FTR1/Fip1/EfeU [Chaetomium strumarium]
MPDVFSVPIFLVTFREALETVIIVSVLLAFLKQTLNNNDNDSDRALHKRLVRQVWLGTLLGLVVCLVIAAALIAVFYTAGANKWDASEMQFEGAFSLVASLIISVVGAALLRIGKMQDKWRAKLAGVMDKQQQQQLDKTGTGTGATATTMTMTTRWGALKRWMERYAMFALPFVTVLREGIEAVVFIAGVTFTAPATAVPLPVVVGIAAGAAVGYLLYKGGSTSKLQLFLVISTCLLYLVAAGLFSRAVWSFEAKDWQDIVGSDAAELGEGPGSYDVDRSVWHVNCCSPNYNGGGGWGFFNAIFGWQNSATYGSVISYNVYWICVMASFFVMRYREVKGHWPLMKAKSAPLAADAGSEEESSEKPASRGAGDNKAVSRDEVTVLGV